MSVEGKPEPVTQDHYARLARHRGAGWDVDSRRDGFALYSALKRPSTTCIIYVVAASIPELVQRIDEIEAGAETVPDGIAEAARRAAHGARERAEHQHDTGEEAGQ